MPQMIVFYEALVKLKATRPGAFATIQIAEPLTMLAGSTHLRIIDIRLASMCDRVPCRVVAIVSEFFHSTCRLTVLDVTSPECKDQTGALLQSLALDESQGFSVEKQVLRPDGSPVWVHEPWSMQKDDANRPLQIIIICEDLTRLRMAEGALRENGDPLGFARLVASNSQRLRTLSNAYLVQSTRFKS
jgi:hypothetical protein